MKPKLLDLRGYSNQRGVVLVLVLIFLAVLALLGTGFALNNTLEERMAGNTRSRDLAFQAAEAALADAQARWKDERTKTFDGNSAYYAYDPSLANDSAYWTNYSWANALAISKNLNQVSSQPRFRYDKMPNVGSTEYFRVTARGVGADENSVVILQAIYSYTP